MDAELADEVGAGFYARIRDMFEIDAASRGKVACRGCGREIAWSAHCESYSGKNLLPKAKAPKEKMLLIDGIIHRFHLQYEASIPMRPTAVNLLEGSSGRIRATLEALAYSDKSCAPKKRGEEFHTGLTNRYRVFLERNGGISGVRKMAAALGIPRAKDIPVASLIDIIGKRTKERPSPKPRTVSLNSRKGAPIFKAGGRRQSWNGRKYCGSSSRSGAPSPFCCSWATSSYRETSPAGPTTRPPST